MFASFLLAAAMHLQPGPPLAQIVCESDPATGELDIFPIIEAPAEPFAGPEAAGLDWYRTGEPIEIDGVRYEPVGSEWSPGGAVNRYLRHVGLHRGAPLFSVWPGGDIDLAVLVRQEGCVFRTYEQIDEVEGEP